ncbi:MAG TPA: FAD/NAD(P)-binding oxidoreductase [Chitinophagales bacterium]|nr:FAD/NAD(P)-binding oxidoreductase [Chitinophagales bacterium]
MQNFHYLIIGGGMTADAAVKGIRSLDQKNSIAIISNEDHPPYSRPPLTKGLWKGDAEETIWKKTEEKNATILLSRSVVTIDPSERMVIDDQDEKYSYEKLLIATGGTINRLPFEVEGIIYYRTYDDYKNLRKQTERAKHIVVIGGGFIGSEAAAALAMNNKKVTMIFPDDAIGSRVYPPTLAGFINSYYQEKGVTIINHDEVVSLSKNNSAYTIKTKGGKTLEADVVVAGIGIKPNISPAEKAGIAVSNGIDTDEFLRSNQPDIYAAGDVANFYSPALGKRMRVEHEDNALTMGEHAGKNMAGGTEKYTHLPFFYSDLFDLGYEAVGELDSRHQMVEDWKEPFREGVVYYLENGRVRGVLLWNTWNQVDHARELISQKGPFDEKNVKGLLPK